MDKTLKLIQKRQTIYFIFILIKISLCLEEPEPEVFLPPRNFNPHPYEARSRTKDGGPVVFPRTEEDSDPGNRNNIISIPRQVYGHPVDNHPYSQVAKRNRYRLAGKYHNKDNSVHPKIIQALGIHAAKVLTRPVENLKEDYIPTTSIQKPKQNYAFAYKVVDHLTGDDFSHRQSQNSKSTKGEYRVKLPDGRVQIVSYTADKNGYKAEVKYTDDQAHTEDAVQIQKVPVRQLKPVKQRLFDYFDILQPVKAVYPTQVPLTNVDYGNYVTPRPGDIFIPHTLIEQPRLQPKVQIITTNPRDYSSGSYIPVTVSPIYLQHPKNTLHTTSVPIYDDNSNFVSTTISPLVVNNGNHGHIIPKTQQDYKVQNDNYFLVTTVAPSTVAPKDILVNGARYTLLKDHHLSDLGFKKK